MQKYIATIIAICFIFSSFLNLATASDLPLKPEDIIPGISKPDALTQPPTITYLSNVTAFSSSTISFPIQIKTGDSISAQSKTLDVISFKCDGLANSTELYRYSPKLYNYSIPETWPSNEFSTIVNLTGVSEGNHTLTLKASETGYYIHYRNSLCYADTFVIDKTSTFNFTVDTTPPTFEVSIENKTYSSTSLPLTVSTNETGAHITYNLDYNRANLTLSENATLSGLEPGNHNLTIFVSDLLGNTGSETVDFNMAIPVPVLPIGLAVSVICLVLLLFVIRKKVTNR